MSLLSIRRIAAIGAVVLGAACAPAFASVVGSDAVVDFTGGSFTFGYLGQSFTLSDNGSGFPSPTSASTAGTAMYAKDFFGISVFFDPPRNTLVFDQTYLYDSYPSATILSFSGPPSIIGLALTAADGVHYGYAQFAGTVLQSYAFESVAGVGIAALAPITAGVPEPESLALVGIGALGLLVAARRKAKG